MQINCVPRRTVVMGTKFVSPKVYLKKRGHWNPEKPSFSIHMENGSKQHKEMEDVEIHGPGPPFKEGHRCSPARGEG